MLARMFIFRGLSFLAKTIKRQSHDLRATVARRSRELLEAVDGNKCSQFNWANIV